MAFLRFNRDKRGYEHFYLVESTTNRRGKTRARVLYWFRTPPNVKVGREPFDEGVRRALEQQNPGVLFDWRKITETPIPSADAERWRERRRLERAEKAARRAEAASSRGAVSSEEPPDLEAPDLAEGFDPSEVADPAEPAELLDAGELEAPSAVLEEALGGPDHIAIAVDAMPADRSAEDAAAAGAPLDDAPGTETSMMAADAMATDRGSVEGGGQSVDASTHRRRRRRRRGRRGRPGPYANEAAAAPNPQTPPAAEPPSDPPEREPDGD